MCFTPFKRKRLLFAIVLCGNFRNTAFNLRKAAMETQLASTRLDISARGVIQTQPSTTISSSTGRFHLSHACVDSCACKLIALESRRRRATSAAGRRRYRITAGGTAPSKRRLSCYGRRNQRRARVSRERNHGGKKKPKTKHFSL